MVPSAAYAFFCFLNACLASNVFAYRLSSRGPPAGLVESSVWDGLRTKRLNQEDKSSVLNECIMEECRSLPPSRKIHCNEACLRYATGFDKFIKKSDPVETTVRNERYQYGSPRVQYRVPVRDNIIGYERGSPYNGEQMRPVFNSKESTSPLSNLIGGFRNSDVNMEDEADYDVSDDLCSRFCAEGQYITTFENCLEMFCEKQWQFDNNNDDELPDTNNLLRSAKVSANSSNKSDTGKRMEKRWPSRISCIEMKCGRFAGNQQKFYDCGMRMCSE